MLPASGPIPPPKGELTHGLLAICILTRQSAGLDTKWYVNRVFQHSDNTLPEEVTAPEFRAYNARFDALHASSVFPILPAVLNQLGGRRLGAD